MVLAPSVTRRLAARAWRATLASASCATRNRACCAPGGRLELGGRSPNVEGHLGAGAKADGLALALEGLDEADIFQRGGAELIEQHFHFRHRLAGGSTHLREGAARTLRVGLEPRLHCGRGGLDREELLLDGIVQLARQAVPLFAAGGFTDLSLAPGSAIPAHAAAERRRASEEYRPKCRDCPTCGKRERERSASEWRIDEGCLTERRIPDGLLLKERHHPHDTVSGGEPEHAALARIFVGDLRHGCGEASGGHDGGAGHPDQRGFAERQTRKIGAEPHRPPVRTE